MNLFSNVIFVLTLSSAAFADCGLKENVNSVDVVAMQDYQHCEMSELVAAEGQLISEMSRVVTLAFSVNASGQKIDKTAAALAPYKAALALVRVQKIILSEKISAK